ncbi:hypothetical protein D3C84_1273240 [compost metagenome]
MSGGRHFLRRSGNQLDCCELFLDAGIRFCRNGTSLLRCLRNLVGQQYDITDHVA